MLEKDTIALKRIENTCGQCSKLYDCSFGIPAIDTLTRMKDTDQKPAILYLWDKYQGQALAICPEPAEITGANALLNVEQRQNPKNTA